MAFDDPAVILNLFTALTLLVGLAFGLKGARDFERKRREDATMRILEQFMTEEFAAQILRIGSMEGPADPSLRTTMDLKDRIRIIQFTQQMETLGVLVADRVIEIDIVEKALGSFVTDAWHKTKAVAFHLREVNRDPKVAEYFQWLAERIEARAAAENAPPAYLALRGWQP